MRKLSVVVAAALICLLSIIGLGLTSSTAGPGSKVGSSHFACLAAWNLGICIGPPTSG